MPQTRYATNPHRQALRPVGCLVASVHRKIVAGKLPTARFWLGRLEGLLESSNEMSFGSRVVGIEREAKGQDWSGIWIGLGYRCYLTMVIIKDVEAVIDVEGGIVIHSNQGLMAGFLKIDDHHTRCAKLQAVLVPCRKSRATASSSSAAFSLRLPH
ncbi:hypothetical protein IEQ34_022325 [Dendrobium chrysotoxum]|uniref:Uncharacterized protein n=1 Tax=Dendrobium chrysotoxum TaxID=161865 RepID=A0AAV7FX72_DENCH|nr:hypothetical protein IEQ34_022325 [Dendrobium chrysotoxum]